MSIYTKERALSGALHFLSGRAIGGAASFVCILLMVRYMGTAEYAAYTALTGLVMLGVNVSSLGLERAIARYVPEGVVSERTTDIAVLIHRVTVLRAIAATCFALVTAMLWDRLTRFLGIGEMVVFPLTIALAVVGGSVFQIQCAVFQALMRQQVLARLLAAQWGSRLLMTLLFIHWESNISLAQSIWILAAPEVLAAMISYFAIREAVKSKVSSSDGERHRGAAWPDRKSLLEVSGSNYLFNLLAVPPQGQVMRLVIAALCPPHFVAAYGFFQSLAEKARQYLPAQLLHMLVEPFLIARYIEHGNAQALQRRTNFLFVLNLLVLMPAIAVVIGCGESLTSGLTGGRYAEYWWLLIPALVQLVMSTKIILQKILLTALDATATLIAAAVFGLFFFGAALFLAISLGATSAIPLAPLTYFAVVIAYLSLNKTKQKCVVSINAGLWFKLLLLFAFAAAGATYLTQVWVANAVLVTAACSAISLGVFAAGAVALGIVDLKEIGLLLRHRQRALGK